MTDGDEGSSASAVIGIQRLGSCYPLPDQVSALAPVKEMALTWSGLALTGYF